jgi:hypothetical protein
LAPGPWLQEIIILAEESLKSEQKMKKSLNFKTFEDKMNAAT